MFIYMIGWHWKHGADLSIERPDGHYGTQIILVCTKGRLKMGDKEYHVQPNTAFVVKSCMPHCIYADGEEYMDDWIRFSLEDEDLEYLDKLGITYNEPIPLPDDSLSKLICACEELFGSQISGKNDALRHIMNGIFAYIGSCCKPKPAGKHNYYDAELEKIRRKIYSSPEKEWNVPDIAAELNISVSHFQRLYKNLYGISCMKDVWTSRMEYAKQLLLNTALTAGEIAEMCGYQNYEYFSRSFVKYACVSPAKFRQKYAEK